MKAATGPGAGRASSPTSTSACRSSIAHLDRTKAQQLGVDVQDVFDTMQTYLGSLYVNDFNRFGRTYEVIAQADTPFRSQAGRHPAAARCATTTAQMVPLGSMVSVSETTGPDSAMRYNGFRAADLNGGPAPGYSTGQAQAAITKILDETLPKGMSYRMDRPDLPADPVGQHRAAGLPALRAAGLPGAGGAV